MSEKLLPCPFCGRDDVRALEFDVSAIHDPREWGKARVICRGCGGQGRQVDDEKPVAEARAIAAWNRRTPAPEGEVVAWGCFDANGLDDKLVYRDRRRAEDAAVAFAPSLTVKALYAFPVVPVGSREPVARSVQRAYVELYAQSSDLIAAMPWETVAGGLYRYSIENTLPGIAFRAMATCQDCGGHIEGWICQSCGREFRENDAGNLVFENQPVVPVGVSVDALAQEIRRVDGHHTLGAGALAEALLPFLAALRHTDTGANHD